MFYCINPNYRYQFFSPEAGIPPEDALIDEPSKRNLIGALKALYVAYGGEEEVSNNIVDIIYKIANVINPENGASNISDGELQPVNPPGKDSDGK